MGKGCLFSRKELALAGAVVLCLYVGSHLLLSRYSAARVSRQYGLPGVSLYVPLSLETVENSGPLFWLHHGLRIIYAPLWLVDNRLLDGPAPLRSMPLWAIDYQVPELGLVSLVSWLFVLCCFTASALFWAVVFLASRSTGETDGATAPHGGDTVLILGVSYSFLVLGALLAGLRQGSSGEVAYMAFSQIIAAAVLYHWGLVVLLRRLLRGPERASKISLLESARPVSHGAERLSS